jgi:hypothetical protein
MLLEKFNVFLTADLSLQGKNCIAKNVLFSQLERKGMQNIEI